MALPDAATDTTRRRQARAEATRLALLDAAVEEFAAHGFEGASTRAIAARAGTHQPQINYHFDSKEALWRAAVDRLFDRLDELLGVTPDAGLDPAVATRDGFAAMIRAFVRAVARLPELNRIMVQEATVDSDRLAWIVDRHTRPRYAMLAGAWCDLRDAGAVPRLDETVLYYSMVGGASLAYVNAAEARLLGVDPIDDAFVEAHAEALVTMMLGPDPDPPVRRPHDRTAAEQRSD
ncbi:MAG: helix-turn-helix domain-containing protein [Actinomycetota bacterium]